MNEKIKIGSFVNVQAFKYDGTLYRQWNGVKVIANTSEYVCCLLNKTKVIEITGQKWTIKEPTLWFFSKNYFFNVTILSREEGLYYYVNLASPFYFEDNSIKYVDFDYDIKNYPKKSFAVIDHVDFETNKEKWYNQNITNAIYKNIACISEQMHKKEGIFDESYIYNIFDSLVYLNEINKNHHSLHNKDVKEKAKKDNKDI